MLQERDNGLQDIMVNVRNARESNGIFDADSDVSQV